MATTSATATDRGRRPPGARQAAPLDALHAARRPTTSRGADHRPRRGALRLGRARQPLPRRALGAVLRQRRPRPDRARRGRGARRSSELDFFTIWSYAHPRAIELAARIASLAPGDLNRVFFTSGGSEAVESAIKLARAYHQRTGNPRKTKFISREIAYHGTTLGALAATGISALRNEFEPLVPGGFQVPNTNSYRWPADRDPLWAADQIEEKILYEGPDTVAAVILEPLQNAGGCIPPQDGYFQRVREICDRHNVLLISDEVICAWGRLGHWFGCERYGYQPDIMTIAKALTSAYVPMGGDDRLRPGRRAVHAGQRVVRPRPHLRRPPGRGGGGDGQPRRVRARGHLRPRARARRASSAAMLESLRDIPIVGDVRGAGFFHAIELVKDQETKEGFTDEESEWLLRGFLSGELFRRGLICRADDRGDPVIQLAPTLICDTEQFEEIENVLRPVLTEASERIEEAEPLDRSRPVDAAALRRC